MRFISSLLLALLVSAQSLALPIGAQHPTKPKNVQKAQSQVGSSSANFEKNEDFRKAKAGDLKIKSVEAQGQRKIEKDAILNRLKSKVGAAYSSDDIRDDVLTLFKTGYFLDVQVDREVSKGEAALVFRVVEKPSIAEIAYEGNSELKSEEIGEAAGIKQFEILNMTKLREGVEKIQKLYEDKGYFLAKIEPKIEDVKKDESVKVTYKITEGDKVKVKKVIFIGNQKLSDVFLKSKMYTQEEGYFTGLSGSGAYKQEAFERDIQVLRFTYYNQGYIQAKLDRPQVTVTPDKRGIYLTIRVEEGEQYEVGEVDFAGDLMFPRDELFQSIQIDENKVFAYDVLQKDLGELQAKYGDLGYAYANIIPRWNFNEKEKKVNIVFEIDKGNKVYFGSINMVGNSKTRDKVIRREMKIREGELYNETRRRQSLENIQRLGFFEDVNFKTSTPADKLDVMNVEIVVKERSTGQVQVSAGYGTSQGLTFGGSVQQTNFLGKGQNLAVSAQLTNISSLYDVSFTEPYFNDSDWSAGFRVFQSSNTGRADYAERKTGGSATLGHPVAENTRFYLTYGYNATRLDPIYDVTKATNGTDVYTLVTDYDLFPINKAEGDASTVSGSLEYDTRNDRFRPSKGLFARAAVSNSGWLGGNLKYYKASADFRYFKNLFWDVVWRNSVQYGKIGSLDNVQDPPFSELFLLGGPYSLRGFRYGRVGRMIYSDMTYRRLKASPAFAGATEETLRANSLRFFGGQEQLQYQTELQFPLIREADMFGIVFYDIGEAEDTISSSRLFSDWGLGIRWFSPIGPLRFEWGFPIEKDPLYHESMVFEFSIGTPF